MSDFDFALARLRGLVGDQDPNRIVAFVHDGAPVSKARSAAGAEAALTAHFQRALNSGPSFTGTIAIAAVFFRPNRQRIDGDNLMKVVMDAATKARVWRDDSQVAAHAAFIEIDTARPRTVVALCPYQSSIDRAPLLLVCQVCGRDYERPEWYQRHRKATYCSQLCAQKRKLAPVTCPRCDTTFQRRTAGQRYCSTTCARGQRRVRQPAATQRPPATCTECGRPVSRREYQKCSNCRGLGRPL